MRSSARLEHPLPPIVALADTQRQIADALHTHETVSAGQPVASLQLGAVSLHPQQRATAQHLRTIIARHGGALLADDVGTGKTFVALDVASEYDMVHVIAPATLLPMWRSAIQRTIGRRAHLHSLQRFSRTPRHRIAEGPGTLVIIDEAHQLRNTNTTRYRTIAHAIAGAHTLLLSATPLHNNSDELRTLCALFTHNLHSDLIVRRTLVQPTQAPRPAGLPGKPVVREHRSAGAPQDSRTLELILSLPAPLPTHEGAAASALIRLGLLRAWCSSDAALSGALRQRQLRGQAMQDALQTGRHPTSRELQSWIVGDSGGQLGFPELLATHHGNCDALIPTLERHLDAIAELARHHARSATGDACRAALLKRIMRKHHDVPVIAFSQFERTAVALHRALRNTPGIGLLTSTQGRIASGPIAREELLALFAPRAQGKPPPPPHQAVRLLLATDLLAEGVNLQDAGVVVHLDLPWTDALLRQRVGRSARLGSPHHTVHVYRLRASVAASRALRAEARIAEKARLAIRHVTGTRHRPGRADTVARLLDATISWSHADSDTRGPLPASHSGDQPMTLSVCHRLDTRQVSQALVRLDHVGPTRNEPTGSAPARAMLAVVTPAGRHKVNSSPRALLDAVLAVGQARGDVCDTTPLIARAYASIWRTLAPWIDRVDASESLGLFTTDRWHARERGDWHTGDRFPSGGATHTPPSRAQIHAHRLLQRAVASLPVNDRTRERGRVDRIGAAIDVMRGAGFAEALTTWCAQAPAPRGESVASVRAWLDAWSLDPLRHEAIEMASVMASTPPVASTSAAAPVERASRWRVTAMILLLPISIHG